MKKSKFLSKFRIYPSFIVLVVFFVVFSKFKLFVNYILALSFHEFAHLIVANAKGYKLKEFRIDIFGASMELDDFIDDRDGFLINIAGPVANISLCVLCLATYYLIPKSYIILNEFCLANFVLAVFNLLPIYPLDGGKVFTSFFKSDKSKRVFNLIAKVLVVLLLFGLFIFKAVSGKISLVLILLIIFVLTSKSETKLSLALFKNKDFKHVQSVNILRINDDDSLISILKHVKKNRYTVFYLTSKSKFIDEDYLLDLALKNDPNCKVNDLV